MLSSTLRNCQIQSSPNPQLMPPRSWPSPIPLAIEIKTNNSRPRIESGSSAHTLSSLRWSVISPGIRVASLTTAANGGFPPFPSGAGGAWGAAGGAAGASTLTVSAAGAAAGSSARAEVTSAAAIARAAIAAAAETPRQRERKQRPKLVSMRQIPSNGAVGRYRRSYVWLQRQAKRQGRRGAGSTNLPIGSDEAAGKGSILGPTSQISIVCLRGPISRSKPSGGARSGRIRAANQGAKQGFALAPLVGVTPTAIASRCHRGPGFSLPNDRRGGGAFRRSGERSRQDG